MLLSARGRRKRTTILPAGPDEVHAVHASLVAQTRYKPVVPKEVRTEPPDSLHLAARPAMQHDKQQEETRWAELLHALFILSKAPPLSP